MKKEFFTLPELAYYYGKTKQAFWMAIRKGRLKAEFNGYRWLVRRDDVAIYFKTLYCRDIGLFEGGPLLDPGKGEISVKQAANIVGCAPSTIYRYASKGFIPHTRKKKAYVFLHSEVLKFKEWGEKNGCSFSSCFNQEIRLA